MSHSSKSGDEKNTNVWKSLKEYYDDPEILKAKANEFADGVTDDFDPSKLSGVSRRRFLALLTASAALTATACSDYHDRGEIIPYTKRPEEILPGTADYYASTCSGCSQACGVLIKTREGRPIKIDGNPDHPINKGKICSKGHASILNLYDPERLSEPKIRGRKSEWLQADRDIIERLKSAVQNGREIAVISHPVNSPTADKLFADFAAKYPTAKFYFYDLLGDGARRSAWEKCYGANAYPAIKYDQAEVILSIDSDFLGSEGNFIENTRKYTDKRRVVEKLEFTRLYSAEGRLSLTGSMADYRFRVRPDAQYEFVMSLLNEVLNSGSSAFSADAQVKAKTAKYNLNGFASRYGLDIKKLNLLTSDLIKAGGKSVVVAGDTMPEEVHIAVNLLNEVLGNSTMYDFESSFTASKPVSSTRDFQNLVSAMNNGSVEVVINFGANPVYHLSPDYKFDKALRNLKTVISLVESENETSAAGNFTLPVNNQLESWGDYHTRNGVYSLQQPVIAPLFNTRQKEAAMLLWINGDADSYSVDIYHDYLMNSFKENVYSKSGSPAAFEAFWYSALHDGYVIINETSVNSVKFNSSAFINSAGIQSAEGVLLHLYNNYSTGDGRFANNGWLLELPHPVSKVTWDNYAAVSPAYAAKLGVENNDLIEVTSAGKKMNLPVMIQPGMSDDMIGLEFGYGRTVIGDAGKNSGFNATELLSNQNAGSPFIYSGISVAKNGGTYKLISTQEHHALDDKSVKDFHIIRKIIREGTLDEYRNDSEFLREDEEKVFSITKDHKYTGNKWAMAIDLNKCTSCSACITSCNVENNIPVVGKDQVAVGREMHWIRLDRYYSGTPEEPVVSNQPMLCQHCDNAPCENVCPVNATNHSPDGLNQMVYNRCVGTRYCSNNCPYKVRRFNFFNFRDHFADAYYNNNLTGLVNNPEVTVRSRGVMEKCTFCIQRIMDARSVAIKEGRDLKGSDVVTACQQACPSQAIVFGDANDKDSEIAKYRSHNLAYSVLGELNVRPNITYIAKLRNTHTEDK